MNLKEMINLVENKKCKKIKKAKKFFRRRRKVFLKKVIRTIEKGEE